MIKLLFIPLLFAALFCNANARTAVQTFSPTDNRVQYFGRADFSNPARPRLWAPGAYIVFNFQGKDCEVLLDDEELYGTTHNYLEIVVDGKASRIKTTTKHDTLKIANNLTNGKHTVIICKDTEAAIGYVALTGINCEALLPPPAAPLRKIEYIGDSITCGSASDLSTPCGTGQWYDQHNAWLSYGAVTARNLSAQYHISAVSGIGLMHSCCGMKQTMSDVYDRVNFSNDSLKWDFKKYQPDVVTVCLGQNDGIQDSVAFCKAYILFIDKLRQYYPKADIVCLNSPMGNEELNNALKKYMEAVNNYYRNHGDQHVSHYFFNKRYDHGCGTHPDTSEHRQIATELTAYLKKLKGW
ncbi:GDSL-type esterase/lipase family protein [Mucilaginibacter sp. RS28]|uniref:GDSL-type esterase/lipase family protein n=1 Tax=Mucilaginibacter straminoryzae TaxID=2932774 RepID=A0A9X1WZ32_9SPHI|nr:SGNH/GDSL hydrolase family protein [Mucilaginibacter straminoryzae]MCJ8208297.1 GDSL-type esterase/lipase family protein [Mucilaginibacter straminoryzae]